MKLILPESSLTPCKELALTLDQEVVRKINHGELTQLRLPVCMNNIRCDIGVVLWVRESFGIVEVEEEDGEYIMDIVYRSLCDRSAKRLEDRIETQVLATHRILVNKEAYELLKDYEAEFPIKRWEKACSLPPMAARLFLFVTNVVVDADGIIVTFIPHKITGIGTLKRIQPLKIH